jgi:PiT family inorganic phosphate transporter
MAIGGLLHAQKVAKTMSHKLTSMNPEQGFAANLSTALLVTTASLHGLPVSTTHVSVGALLGVGTMTGQVNWKPVLSVFLSWALTLPCAALFAALVYSLWTPS